MNATERARRHREIVRRNRLIVEELRKGKATMHELAARYLVTRERIRQIRKAGDVPPPGSARY